MMVSMGVYDTLIHCITHLFSEFKRSVKTLLPYAVGMLNRHRGAGQPAEISLRQLSPAHLHDLHRPHPGRAQSATGPKSGTRNWAAVSIGVFVLFFVGIIAMALTGDVSNPDTLTVDVGQMVHFCW